MRPKLKVVQVEKRFTKVERNLMLNNRSGVYYVIKSFKRYKIPALFETTKQTTLGKARTMAEELIAAHMSKYLGDGDLVTRTASTPVRAVIDEILNTVTPLRRSGTQEMHKIYLGELRREWGQIGIDKITLPSWHKWLADFKRRKDRKTFGDYAKHMNLILRYAYNNRHLKHLITVPNSDRPALAGRVFTHDEIKRLWVAMNDDTRDQFVLCYECMMRLREALYLTWERVDLKSGHVTLRPDDVKTGSKTGKGRTFKLTDNALNRLRNRAKTASGSPYVFPSPNDPSKPIHQNKTAWFAAKRKAKIIGRARWHDARHSSISHALLESRVNPVLLSEYAGVSLKTIQRVYLHSTAEQTASISKAVSVFSSVDKVLTLKKRGRK